ncbi:ComEA family DNA-binding protein [Pseudarthrobacter sp. NPDC092424]|uniref:ComEA family DNA-binding protein n=1 Tax=Pseudarthrobacter sp. NPDC092424 TaxID=3364415 RepID=UPI0037F3C99E
MSRREQGACRQGRHARDRLQATLGGQQGASLLHGGEGAEAFQYHGAAGDSGSRGTKAATTGEVRSRGLAEPPAGAGPRPVRLRWRMGLRVALLVAILALCAAAGFWWQAAAERPEVLPLSDVVSEEPPGDNSGTAGGPPDHAGAAEVTAEEPAGRVVVHVAGAVAKPGVVQLPAGSRVHQAIAAAGGAGRGADLNRLNLALVLADGSKIQVPRKGEVLHSGDAPGDSAATGTAGEDNGSGAGGTDGPKVNLNTATLEELDALPKVGPVLAQRILDWRKDHGSFKSAEDLDAVDGVGPRMLETLLPLVTV